MNRRCTTESCQIISAGRTADIDLSLSQVLVNPSKDWQRITAGKIRIARNIDVNWKEFTLDKYIFSHSTIVASVNIEPNGYYIDPVCTPLVNANGNAWSNPVLLATFRSFIGGENYLEHVQVKELSKGKILDAVIRPVTYKNPKTGKHANVYYVDILVATERNHTLLCNRIASGELSTMSMGCVASFVQCSRCGRVLGDDDDNCIHIENQLLKPFTDENGIERITAELCGRCIKNEKGEIVGDPNSLTFIEASWVEKPAFEGAVLNHFLSEAPELTANILSFNTHKLQQSVDDLFRLRVADKRGMMMIRIAMAELNRRKREAMVNRIAKTFWS